MQLRGRVVFPNWPAFDNFPFTAVTQLYDTEIERTDQIQIQIPKYSYKYKYKHVRIQSVFQLSDNRMKWNNAVSVYVLLKATSAMKTRFITL